MSSGYPPYGGTQRLACQRCQAPLLPNEANCRNCGYYNVLPAQAPGVSNSSWGNLTPQQPQSQSGPPSWGQFPVSPASPPPMPSPQAQNTPNNPPATSLRNFLGPTSLPSSPMQSNDFFPIPHYLLLIRGRRLHLHFSGHREHFLRDQWDRKRLERPRRVQSRRFLMECPRRVQSRRHPMERQLQASSNLERLRYQGNSFPELDHLLFHERNRRVFSHSLWQRRHLHHYLSCHALLNRGSTNHRRFVARSHG